MALDAHPRTQVTSQSFPTREEIAETLRLVVEEAEAYLGQLDRQPAFPSRVEESLTAFDEPVPEEGEGAAAALRRLIAGGRGAVGNTSGPRCFHFVIGGTTPAALGADLLATTFDQIAHT